MLGVDAEDPAGEAPEVVITFSDDVAFEDWVKVQNELTSDQGTEADLIEVATVEWASDTTDSDAERVAHSVDFSDGSEDLAGTKGVSGFSDELGGALDAPGAEG